MEILAHQFMKNLFWIKVVAATKEVKPFAAVGHMGHFFRVDDFHRIHRLFVARLGFMRI